MAAKHLNLEPHNMDDDAWWYEEPDGICFVVQFRDKHGHYVGTEMRKLAWGSIRAALGRRDKADRATVIKHARQSMVGGK